MKLSDWLAKENMSQRAFAELIGLTQGRVSQICLRGCGDTSTAHAIIDQTGGEVSLDDLLPVREIAE